MGKPKNNHEVLFDQFTKLVKNTGMQKSIYILKTLNGDDKEYDFIIKTICEVFEITEKKLFDDGSHFTSTDPRRTAYYLMSTELKYSHSQIGVLFNKCRSRITLSLSEFKSMQANPRGHELYLDKHSRTEAMVKEYLKEIKVKTPKKKSV
jgi:chromosomal replication initiation ATPase DnaA